MCLCVCLYVCVCVRACEQGCPVKPTPNRTHNILPALFPSFLPAFLPLPLFESAVSFLSSCFSTLSSLAATAMTRVIPKTFQKHTVTITLKRRPQQGTYRSRSANVSWCKCATRQFLRFQIISHKQQTWENISLGAKGASDTTTGSTPLTYMQRIEMSVRKCNLRKEMLKRRGSVLV